MIDLTPHSARIKSQTSARYYSMRTSAIRLEPGPCLCSEVIEKPQLFGKRPRAVRLCKVTSEPHLVYIPAENVEVFNESPSLQGPAASPAQANGAHDRAACTGTANGGDTIAV